MESVVTFCSLIPDTYALLLSRPHVGNYQVIDKSGSFDLGRSPDAEKFLKCCREF